MVGFHLPNAFSLAGNSLFRRAEQAQASVLHAWTALRSHAQLIDMGVWPFPSERAQPARFTADRVGYAVGDVHGRRDLLLAMLEALEQRAEADTRDGREPVIVFLGDYVDRGTDTRGVIDLFLSGRPFGFERRFLKGNHEQSMLAFMEEPLQNRAWVFHGGVETLRSYGVQPPPVMGADEEALTRAAADLMAALPGDHRNFLESLERYVVEGDYLFVHAGVDVAKTLDQQSDADLYWSRERFLKARRRFPYRVVHGHTPVGAPFADARRVSIDTGAYATGVLTAARLDGAELSFFDARGGSAKPEASK